MLNPLRTITVSADSVLLAIGSLENTAQSLLGKRCVNHYSLLQTHLQGEDERQRKWKMWDSKWNCGINSSGFAVTRTCSVWVGSRHDPTALIQLKSLLMTSSSYKLLKHGADQH